MRKAMTVILWLGLTACLILVISLSGQKRALEREGMDQARKNEELQTLYEQMKDEWTEKEAALTVLRECKEFFGKERALAQNERADSKPRIKAEVPSFGELRPEREKRFTAPEQEVPLSHQGW